MYKIKSIIILCMPHEYYSKGSLSKRERLWHRNGQNFNHCILEYSKCQPLLLVSNKNIINETIIFFGLYTIKFKIM